MNFKEEKRKELEEFMKKHDDIQEKERVDFINKMQEQREKLLQRFGQNNKLVADLINNTINKGIDSINKIAVEGKQFRNNMLQSF